MFLLGHTNEPTFEPSRSQYALQDMVQACPELQDERRACPALLVMDLRSYTAALGNRAKGGGCECTGKGTITHMNDSTSLRFFSLLIPSLSPSPSLPLCLHSDYYPNCEVVYKNLPNIHSVRKSFQQLRTVLLSEDQNK